MEKYQDIQVEQTKGFYRVVDACRLCGSSELHQYLDLGFTPPADQFRKKEELVFPEISYPLRVLLCKNCGLSQLSHVIDPRILYQHDYPYESSTTKTGKLHWDDFAAKVVKRLGLPQGSVVVDVGSNVGTLLFSFKELGMKVHGVDPAPNIAEMANENGIATLCEFFSTKSVPTLLEKNGNVDVIVGTNVFAHIDDLYEVMRAVELLLKEKGVFIFESPYLKHLVKNLEYDTIYHEHLSYLSLSPLVPFFASFGMEIFAVEESEIHGGSMRVHVSKKGVRDIDPEVFELIAAEEKEKLHTIELLQEFAQRVEKNRKDLMDIIEKLVSQGKSIAVVSTPAKGMTLLNYCGITHRHIVFATEKSRLKIGRYTPGGHIPILPDEALLSEKPDYALLLAWNFSKEIMANLKAYSDAGGKFIIPIPEPIII